MRVARGGWRSAEAPTLPSSRRLLPMTSMPGSRPGMTAFDVTRYCIGSFLSLTLRMKSGEFEPIGLMKSLV